LLLHNSFFFSPKESCEERIIKQKRENSCNRRTKKNYEKERKTRLPCMHILAVTILGISQATDKIIREKENKKSEKKDIKYPLIDRRKTMF
jgi:hypothetical protein